MNKRLNLRNENRKTKEFSKRGRPKKKENQTKRTKYLGGFDREDLDMFLSCLIMMGNLNEKKIKNYFEYPSAFNCGHGQFFNRRLSKSKFIEMFNCIDIDIENFVGRLNHKFKSIHTPSREITIDESIVPHRTKIIPHFLFIPRKPFPYGTKLITTADSNTFIIDI